MIHPLGHLRVTYARGRLYIRRNWTFSPSPTVETLWAEIEVGVFRRGWVILSADFREKGASPINHCWCQKTSDCCFVWCQNIRSASFSFVTIHASDRQTDRRTDRQNCDSNTVRCITCSRTVKVKNGHGLDQYDKMKASTGSSVKGLTSRHRQRQTDRQHLTSLYEKLSQLS